MTEDVPLVGYGTGRCHGRHGFYFGVEMPVFGHGDEEDAASQRVADVNQLATFRSL